MRYNLPDYRQVSTLCLQNHKSLSPLSARTPTHLTHHHECMLIGTKVRIVHHCICIEYPYNANIVEIKAFTNHLSAYKYVRSSC